MVYGLPSSTTVERNLRKDNARALSDLGFEPSEIARILGYSLNTINNYLKETTGVHFSDTFNFAFDSNVFPNFNIEEQNLLNKLKSFKDNLESLRYEVFRTDKIVKGIGILGWIHKKILKDDKDYEVRRQELLSKIAVLKNNAEPLIIQSKDVRKSPHLSKSILKISINDIK